MFKPKFGFQTKNIVRSKNDVLVLVIYLCQYVPSYYACLLVSLLHKISICIHLV